MICFNLYDTIYKIRQKSLALITLTFAELITLVLITLTFAEYCNFQFKRSFPNTCNTIQYNAKDKGNTQEKRFRLTEC